MKTKQLLLGIITLNLVGVAILALSRLGTGDYRLGHEAANVVSVPKTSRIPPRPDFPQPAAATAMQLELAALRDHAFDTAEFTVARLRNSPGALCLLGKLHLRNNDLDGARLLWEQALVLDADCVEAYVDLGHLESIRGNWQQGEAFFIQAIEKSPQTLEAYEPLTTALLQQAKFSDAAERLKQFLSLAAESVSGWCSLGRVQQEMIAFEQAVDSFRRALELDPNSEEAILGLMNAYRSLGDETNARATATLLKRIVADQPRVAQEREVVFRDLQKMRSLLVFTTQTSADLLAQSGEVPAAIAQLESTLERIPDARQLSTQLSQIYFSQGSVDQAIRVMRAAAETAPKDPFGWMELALLCIQGRRLDAAEGALQQVIRLSPANDRAYALLAQTQMPTGRDQPAAIESARRAVAISPTPGNHYILATAYYNSGDIESTKTELRTAISLAPDESEYRDALRRIE